MISMINTLLEIWQLLFLFRLKQSIPKNKNKKGSGFQLMAKMKMKKSGISCDFHRIRYLKLKLFSITQADLPPLTSNPTAEGAEPREK